MSPRDNKKTLAERTWAWLKGDLRHKEERQLFQETEQDPFLKEALEGYQRFPEGDHIARINNIKGKLQQRKKRGLILPIRIAAAAASILVVTFSAWWLTRDPGNDLAMKEEAVETEQVAVEDEIATPELKQEDILPSSTVEEEQNSENKEIITSINTQKSNPPPQPEPPVEEDIEEEEESLEMLDISSDDVPTPPPPVVTKPVPAPAPVQEEKMDLAKEEIQSEPRTRANEGRGAVAKKRQEKDAAANSFRKMQPANARTQQTDELSNYQLLDNKPLKHQVTPFIAQPIGGFPNLSNHLDSTVLFSSDPNSIINGDTLKGFFELEFFIDRKGKLSKFVSSPFSKGTEEEIQSLKNALKSGPRWEFLGTKPKKKVKVKYRYLPFKE